MTAKSLDSDLDLAYHIQMQEAMTASLALQPSTSRRPSAAATVILRELNDRVLREPEIGELREDLDRRIHHQRMSTHSRASLSVIVAKANGLQMGRIGMRGLDWGSRRGIRA
ncbi:hypothetical protein FH972_017750 [Carpinus fangiana]|uniref:Uncharacterized protein n=1 Tax=Carpinus fangiana TaxID=176857 RepID=A0A5N6RMV2_9ROSI|nr:hypothetical protein FH972_017750 [Carpinus fangiana]